MDDRKYERVICPEDLGAGFRQHNSPAHFDGGRRSRLRALLIGVDKRLVDHIADGQPFHRADSAEVGLIESTLDSQRG